MRMRNDSRLNMERYVEAARAHHDLNPQDEKALHEQHLESLGLHPAAKEHIINERMAAVAATLSRDSGKRGEISKLDERSQIAAIDKLHQHEQHGVDHETASDNEKTDRYLQERGRGRR